MPISDDTVQQYDRLTSALSCVHVSKKRSVHYQRPRVTLDDESDCCYVSRQWMHEFETFVSPAPVDNRDFLCQHGGTFHCLI